MHCSLFLKESLILRRDDSLQFVAFINKKLYTKEKWGDQGMKIKEGNRRSESSNFSEMRGK